MKKRFDDIDIIRGTAILAMIGIHTYGLHLGNSRDFIIWNWLHFVVPLFLFCSGFVLASSSKTHFPSTIYTFKWIKKRGIRLLLPYYIYFGIHFLLFILFPGIFSNFQFQKNISFLLSSLTFTGGLSVSWLPILFLELTSLSPLLMYLQRKKLLTAVHLVLLGIIAIHTIFQFNIPFQTLTHWVFWLYPFVLGIIFSGFSEKEKMRISYGGAILSAILFIFIYKCISVSGISLVLTHHKYPPDLYYLSYSLLIGFVLIILSRVLSRFPVFLSFISFFSKKSYALFFTHFVILDLTFTVFLGIPFLSNTFIQTVFVVALTSGCILFWENRKKLLSSIA